MQNPLEIHGLEQAAKHWFGEVDSILCKFETVHMNLAFDQKNK